MTRAAPLRTQADQTFEHLLLFHIDHGCGVHESLISVLVESAESLPDSRTTMWTLAFFGKRMLFWLQYAITSYLCLGELNALSWASFISSNRVDSQEFRVLACVTDLDGDGEKEVGNNQNLQLQIPATAPNGISLYTGLHKSKPLALKFPAWSIPVAL